MKSQVVKRSIVIAGHKTSVSLEDAFWKGLKEIAAMRNIPLSDLVSTIDNERQHGNLSSAIRQCGPSRRICAPSSCSSLWGE
jgi:predicted DNA-binding ribbon-helix-helix protein